MATEQNRVKILFPLFKMYYIGEKNKEIIARLIWKRDPIKLFLRAKRGKYQLYGSQWEQKGNNFFILSPRE